MNYFAILQLGIILSIIHNSIFVRTSTTPIQCNDLYSCTLQNINISSLSNGNLNCYGYYSCAYATKIENTMSNTAVIRCYGSHSCFGSKLIDNKGTIQCFGRKSCSYIDLINSNGNGGLFCSGEKSCQKSTIIMNSTNGLWCEGYQSCSHANITVLSSQTNILMRGNFAAYNATIRIIGNSNSIFFDGSDSGYQTTVFWKQGNTGTIYCRTANACSNLTLVCSIPGECDFDTIVACWGVDKSEVCPDVVDEGVNVINYDDVNSESIYDIGFESYNDSIMMYNNNENSTFGCDGLQSCLSTSILLSISGTSGGINYINKTNDSYSIINIPLRCTGFLSCFVTEVIMNNSNININNNNNNNDKYNYNYNEYYNDSYTDYNIRCDGYQSCVDIPNYIINYNKNGNMYFSGSTAVSRTEDTMIKIENAHNNNNNTNSDIFCSGESSCNYTILNYGKTLYCHGYKSCGYSMINNLQTVWITGAQTAQFSDFRNISGNLFCMALSSCEYTNIFNVNGYVYGGSHFALEESNFANIGGIVCLKTRSCRRSTIQNVTLMGSHAMHPVESLVISSFS